MNPTATLVGGRLDRAAGSATTESLNGVRYRLKAAINRTPKHVPTMSTRPICRAGSALPTSVIYAAAVTPYRAPGSTAQRITVRQQSQSTARRPTNEMGHGESTRVAESRMETE